MDRIRVLIFNFLYYAGIAHLFFLTNKLNKKIPIILFHRVSPESSPCWPPLTPVQFESTIDLLSKHFSFYSLDDLLDNTIKKKSNACCVVFDDGYYDFKEYALPVLINYNVPVTLFLPTDNIEHNKPLWTSVIDDIIMHTPKSKNDSAIDIKGEQVILNLVSDKGLFNTANTIKQILIKMGLEERDKYVERLNKQLHSGEKSYYDPMLSWSDVEHIVYSTNGLINIQSHTHTHPYLPSLQVNEITEECNKPFLILDQKNFNSINKIAYPIGGFNEKVEEIAGNYYCYGFVVGNKHLEISEYEKNKFQIPRFNIHTTNPKETFLFVNGFHTLVTSIVRNIKSKLYGMFF